MFILSLYTRVREKLNIDYESFVILQVVVSHSLYQVNKTGSKSYSEIKEHVEKLSTVKLKKNLKLTFASISEVIQLPRETVRRKVLELCKKDILKFYRTYSYDTNSQKITAQIEKITNYRERKHDLERRIKLLEKSDLYKDKNELKKLEQMHTLGEVNFDSVVILDFGERLKSVLTSFIFSDVSSNRVSFFTINQWFDETFFNESAMENLHFPSINLDNLKKFNKKYFKTYNKKPHKVSILAYDALGLIYYCWLNNNFQFRVAQLYNKDGFKGLHGEFNIIDNFSKQKLKIYKVSKKKFEKVY